jgi:hypothetical protein
MEWVVKTRSPHRSKVSTLAPRTQARLIASSEPKPSSRKFHLRHFAAYKFPLQSHQERGKPLFSFLNQFVSQSKYAVILN